MKKIIDKIRQYPFIAAIAVTILYFGCNVGFSLILNTLPEGFISQLVIELVCVAWPLALLFLFGQGRALRLGSVGKAFKTGLCFLILAGVIIVSNVLNTPADAWRSTNAFLIGVISLICVGVREEVIFRGIAADLVARRYANSTKGVYLTVFGTSFLFGALHMQNLLAPNEGILYVVTQSIMSWSIGSVFCAIYLRGGSIWGLALLHSLFDAMLLFRSYFTTIDIAKKALSSFDPTQLAICAVMFALALFLLRKKKMAGVIERFQNLEKAA